MSSAPANDPPNQRRGRRTPFRQACTAILPGDVQRPVVICDLGVEGLSFRSSAPIAPGSRCRLSFELPQGTGNVTVQVQARTVYSSFVAIREFRIGAAFVDLDPSSAAVICAFMAEGG
jgi:hypothetical protein